MPHSRRVTRWSVLLLALGLATRVCADSGRNAAQSESRTQALIQQLSSNQYAIRKAADDELRRLGRSAIDQLLVAQHDENPEIRLAVRELLAHLPIPWPTDAPAIIQEITNNYARLSRREKSLYTGWLVRLEDGIGLPSLIHIVRYESSDIVAKQAALAIIEELDQDDPVQVAEFLAAHQQIATSKRAPATWLKRFAYDLSAKPLADQKVPTWKALAEQESELQDLAEFDTFVAAMLYQKWAEAAFQKVDKDESTDAVRELLDLRKESSMLIAETSLWLLDHKQHDLFDALVWKEFDELRESVPLLAYCKYMSEHDQGHLQEAKKAADFAFELTENDEKFPDAFERAYIRLQTARKLELEEYGDAAIREYRRLLDMDSHPQVAGVQYDAASYLSELLHDRQREREAADVLQKLVQLGDGALLDEFDDDASNLSRMYFFRAEQHRQNGERAKQIEFLNKAVEANPTDADVLIAMHRLPRADAAWKKRTSRLIESAVQSFDSRLKQLRAAGEFENRGRVATYLNQVAWLVGNTEGDFEKAVAQSRRSLELRPGSAGSLDTLARAYFSAGEAEQAIRYQRRAVRLQPSSHQIIRQLEEFEAASNQVK